MLATGSTAANANYGAQTKLSTILHGVWLILCIALIPNVLNLLPLSSLSAILIIVGLNLTPVSLYKTIYSFGKGQFLPFIVTIVVTLIFDAIKGIFAGMCVSIFFTMKNNVNRSISLTEESGAYVIRFMRDVSFLNKALLRGILASIPESSVVVIDSISPIKIDRDIILTFEDFLNSSRKKNISVKFKKLSFSNYDFFKV